MDYKLTFGKYKDWKIQDIFKADTEYIYWLSQKSKNPMAQKAADDIIASQMAQDEETHQQLTQALHVICRQKRRPRLAPYKHGHIEVDKNEATIEMCTHKIHLDFEGGSGYTEAFHSANWDMLLIATHHESFDEVDEEEYPEPWKKPIPLSQVPKAEDAIWYPLDGMHNMLSQQPMTVEQAFDFLEEHLAKR